MLKIMMRINYCGGLDEKEKEEGVDDVRLGFVLFYFILL